MVYQLPLLSSKKMASSHALPRPLCSCLFLLVCIPKSARLHVHLHLQVVPGMYGFIAQLNEGRASNKRPTEVVVDKVCGKKHAHSTLTYNFAAIINSNALMAEMFGLPTSRHAATFIRAHAGLPAVHGGQVQLQESLHEGGAVPV